MGAAGPDASRRGLRPSLALWVLAGLTASAVLVGAVAGALRGPTDLHPGSPEGVVQAYLQAVLTEDYAAAVGYLDRETAEQCGTRAFADAWVDDWRTVDLEHVRILGQEAHVSVRFRSAPPVTAGTGYGMRHTFVLTDEAGAWRLTEPPWPFIHCPENVR